MLKTIQNSVAFAHVCMLPGLSVLELFIQRAQRESVLRGLNLLYMSNAKYLQPSDPENVPESRTCGSEADFPFPTCSEKTGPGPEKNWKKGSKLVCTSHVMYKNTI